MTVTEIAIKRPTIIVVIFIILTFLGVMSYNKLSYELLPKFKASYFTITTVYPGAAPSEIENSVTKKIEDAVSSLENIKAIRAQSFEGLSFVQVELGADANADAAVQDAQRKVNGVVSQLPLQAKAPVVDKFQIDEFPILRIGAFSDIPSTEFYQLVKDRIKSELAKIDGVAQINLIGGEEREIRVNVDQNKLNAYNISLLQVNQAIANSNVDFPTGSVDNTKTQFLVRLAGKFSSVDEIKNVVIAANNDGSKIKIGDVAEVYDSRIDIHNINRINKKNAIGIMVQKQLDANAVEVTEKVKTALTKLETVYANKHIKFQIAEATSTFTLEAADAVKHDLLIAIFLVGFVMLMFLHSLRNSFIVMVAIPASMVSTFIAMYIFNFSLNLMTLLALSLVIGILVDDSIVVLENIYRHLEKGQDKKTASINGRNEIGFTALSITMVDVVVFLPLTLLNGFTANILRHFSVVVVVATLMSLFVSFTVTPLLASRISKIEPLTNETLGGRISIWIEDFLHSLNQFYGRIISWSLRHKIAVLSIAFASFVGAIMLAAFGFIGSEFVARGDRGEFIAQLELDKGATFEQNNALTQKAEDLLLKMPEVETVFANVGGSTEVFGAGKGVDNKTELTVVLVPAEKRKVNTDEMMEIARKELNKIPGLKVIPTDISFFGGANQASIQVVVSGANLTAVRKVANAIFDSARATPGAMDVKFSVEDGNPEIKVIPDKEKMAQLGLNIAQVGATMQTAFSGNDDSKYKDGENEYPIRIMLDKFDRKSVEDVSNITFVNNRGELIQLAQFATIERNIGPSRLDRRDRSPSITVTSRFQGRKSGDVVADLEKKIKKANFPKDIYINYDGDKKNQDESGGAIGIALITSILLVYLIMVALYDSYIYPFVVLFSIPVAVVGAFLALAMSMSAFSLFTGIGLIMLVGLVCKNAILLVDFTNQLKATGLGTYEALIEAGKERLRPILMTTIAMVFGFMPIALAHGAGAEWKIGLAWALIGGLTSSMFLTLVLVPVVYAIVDSLKDWTTLKIDKIFKREHHVKEVVSHIEFN